MEAESRIVRPASFYLGNKVSGHRSEVKYGANVGAQRAKGDRRRFSRASRQAARAFCKEAIRG